MNSLDGRIEATEGGEAVAVRCLVKRDKEIDLDVYTFDFTDRSSVTINVLSDLHIGNPLSDERRIERYIQYVRESGNFLLLNGDLIECVTRTSKGDIYHLSITSPDAQVDRVVELLAPVKDQILCITSGNHDLRSEGHDYSREIAYRLGVPHSPISALCIFRVGRKPKNGKPYVYTVYQTHGYGGGTSPGGQANAMDRFGRSIIANVVLIAHMHNAMISSTTYLFPDLYNKGMTKVKQITVVTPSFMRYGGYAMRRGYRPPAQNMVEIILYGENRFNRWEDKGTVEVKTIV